MTATYTKLRDGSWGIRVTGGAPKVGARLTVTKKNGEVKTETVTRVLWTGDGVALCSLGGSSGGASRSAGGGVYCGYLCPVSGRRCCAKNGPCHDCA